MFRAIGFVIVLIALRLVMPSVFHAFEHALISFFDLADTIFAFSPVGPNGVTSHMPGQLSAVGSINYIPHAAPLPAALAGY